MTSGAAGGSGPDRRAFLGAAAASLGSIALGGETLGLARQLEGTASRTRGADGSAANLATAHGANPGVLQEIPVPTAAQLRWQRDELAMFLHFGVNTFTNREWGDGTEDPAIFDPTAFDAGQWARVARQTGFKAMVLTAKHHDGLCLWPTETTDHSVASSPFRGGNGDVVGEFVDACRVEGLRVGLYCSPWDRNHPTYGDSPRYNDVFLRQLTELLTRYGDVHEVWFDGANGEDPNGRGQEYDWPRFWAHVLELQPGAVIFSDAGPGVRWIGNERGSAGDPNWSTVDPETVPVPGMTGDEVIRQLQHGDIEGTVWRPGETDVSIRPGWFWHPEEDDEVRSPEDLVDLYFTSVGRNSKLLLNVPPTSDGLLHDADVRSLRGMRERLDALFETDLAEGAGVQWRLREGRPSVGVLELGQPTRVAISDLREDISQGQRVAEWTLEGRGDDGWLELASGETIGYRKLDRFEPRTVTAVRLTVRTIHPFRPLVVKLYGGERL